ncbi:tryptophan 2,3-dioxygenase [Nocardioides terrae]|uniref:Tryptophan 2,3-dioxygenase n=1 Tax=Nocardioides terrae TaxID=574651 RepID=A0A1I1DQ71_9ACTN|nr:tryptophan 2,3-dioxygenase family protein [Nocardioides terrae]SFB76984.1 tryptophan 2,3-dioxygenase [Nocardioides terrae]
MDYGDYLHLDEVLAAQHPLSGEHDELLFIVQHQTSELWMRLLLHELDAATVAVAGDQLPFAFKTTARASKIMEQLVHAWDVLATMTPTDYSKFRDVLGFGSGFQSWQYRCIEFALGNKNARWADSVSGPHAQQDTRLSAVRQALERPSLYDEALRLLDRRGFSIPESRLDRDWTQPYEADDQVEHAWLEVYREPEKHWDLYQLGEELTDLEDAFRLWRFRHVSTVQRIIGSKTGTGGTSGVGYLRTRLDVVLFPELWGLRTEL